MSNQKRSFAFAIVAILLWSTVGTAFKISLRYLNYAELLLLASLVSACLTGITIIFNGQIKLISKTSPKEWLLSASLGFLNPFAYYLILFKAFSLLQAQEAVALNYIWPMMLVLLSVPILKQKIKWTNVIALLISFSGAILIATRGKPFSLDLKEPLGVTLALSSAIFWALFWLMNVRDKREETLKLFMNFTFGFLYTLIFCLFTDNIPEINLSGFLGSVYVGLFEMGITFILWLKALKYAENTARVSNLVYLSPFMSLIFISIVIGEKILLSTLAGLVLIITGIILQQILTRKRKTVRS
jgi:drug/metabolite transporter (DMT)-like permease